MTARPSSTLGWWHAALAMVGGLTTPRADIAECDRIVERQFTSSALAHAARRVAVPVRRAMGESAAATQIRQAWSGWRSLTAAARVRAAGCLTIVTALTVLVLDVAKPGSAQPFFWIVPAIACALGALAAVAPAALAPDE